MENSKSFFLELQKDIRPLSEMELLKPAISQAKEDKSNRSAGDFSDYYGFKSIPIAVVLSLLIWKFMVPDEVVATLTGMPGISFLTKLLCWEGKWYLNILFHLIVDGILSYVVVSKVYRFFDYKHARLVKEAKNRNSSLLTQYDEKRKSLSPASNSLPSYYCNYECVLGIVGIYNLGKANDIEAAIACLDTNFYQFDQLEEASRWDINTRDEDAGSQYSADYYGTRLARIERAYVRYQQQKDFKI